jgi:hypothetical protein
LKAGYQAGYQAGYAVNVDVFDVLSLYDACHEGCNKMILIICQRLERKRFIQRGILERMVIIERGLTFWLV